LQCPAIDTLITYSPSAEAVFCIRSCKVISQDLENACVIAAQIPALQTIFANAIAEKASKSRRRIFGNYYYAESSESSKKNWQFRRR